MNLIFTKCSRFAVKYRTFEQKKLNSKNQPSVIYLVIISAWCEYKTKCVAIRAESNQIVLLVKVLEAHLCSEYCVSEQFLKAVLSNWNNSIKARCLVILKVLPCIDMLPSKYTCEDQAFGQFCFQLNPIEWMSNPI